MKKFQWIAESWIRSASIVVVVLGLCIVEARAGELGYSALTKVATPTLCKEGETTYFSCSLKDTKVVSVCGSGEVEASENSTRWASWLQYRMGRPQALELVFPQQKDRSVLKFEGETHWGLGVRINILSFSINGISYSVESSYSELTKDGFQGVKVGTGRKEYSLPCRGAVTLAAEFDSITDELDPMQK